LAGVTAINTVASPGTTLATSGPLRAAHEQAVGYFTGSGLSGRLRFGVTDDLARTPVPRILRDFRQLYARIDLELTVSQSVTLQNRVESGHLDVAFVEQPVGDRHGRLVRRDRLVWAAVPSAKVNVDAPVPLVGYQAPSITRSQAVHALERAGIAYRVSCTARASSTSLPRRGRVSAWRLRAQSRPA
jgi:DNA-binding transcriptional LysR family regulator